MGCFHKFHHSHRVWICEFEFIETVPPCNFFAMICSLGRAPGANSVLFVEDYDGDYKKMAEDIFYLSENRDAYLSHFAWQKRGYAISSQARPHFSLRKDLVREIFYSNNLLPCRLCEHIDLIHREGRFSRSRMFMISN